MRLCALDELEIPGARGFRFREGDDLFAGFVLRTASGVTGFVDACPHAGAPLAMFDRYLTRTGERLLCASHGALFDLEGRCVAGPCAGDSLDPWAVEVRGGAVFTA